MPSSRDPALVQSCARLAAISGKFALLLAHQDRRGGGLRDLELSRGMAARLRQCPTRSGTFLDEGNTPSILIVAEQAAARIVVPLDEVEDCASRPGPSSGTRRGLTHELRIGPVTSQAAPTHPPAGAGALVSFATRPLRGNSLVADRGGRHCQAKAGGAGRWTSPPPILACP
jgi:hypothetical protein